MVTGNYKVQLYDPRTNGFAPSSPEIGMHVEVRDPDDKIILSKVYSSEGKWTFTSQSLGEHVINYADVAQKEKLSELQLRVRQLLDQVEQITKEQNYQRYREERFRQTSESTNQRVLWWALAQTGILLVMGAWQIKHLKSFFEAKKLV